MKANKTTSIKQEIRFKLDLHPDLQYAALAFDNLHQDTLPIELRTMCATVSLVELVKMKDSSNIPFTPEMLEDLEKCVFFLKQIVESYTKRLKVEHKVFSEAETVQMFNQMVQELATSMGLKVSNTLDATAMSTPKPKRSRPKKETKGKDAEDDQNNLNEINL